MNKDGFVGIKDIAKQANVAVATVDRVIHGRKGVSEKTKEKVLKIIEQANFQPNIMASNLAKNKIFVIGVLLPKDSKHSTYWEYPVRGIKKAQKDLKQYSIEVKSFLFDPGNNLDYRKQILNVINSSIDGLILAPKFAHEIEILLQDCQEKNLPYVFIDSNIPDKNPLCSLQQPLYESGQLAAQLFDYCFDEGQILILHLKDLMDTEEIIRLKEKGMVEYFNKMNPGIFTTKEVITNLDTEHVEESLSRILDVRTDIKGIFIPNSKINRVASYLSQREGRKYYLIGYDLLKKNYKFIENGVIDFLICSKPEEQGYQAFYKLFDSIVLRKNVEKEVIMPLDIITRMNYKFY